MAAQNALVPQWERCVHRPSASVERDRIVEFLASLEQSTLGTFVRESLWVYPTLLVAHAIGLAFVVGIHAAIDLRVLGVARELALDEMRRFLPVFYIGFGLNAISGVALAVGYATTKLVDPIFYAKMLFLLLALTNLQLMKPRIFGQRDTAHAPARGIDVKVLAATSLVFWTGAIVTGRLLEYGFFR